ncbi:MAG: type VI secretion system protein TssA [Thermodesulfobacteriota bacterium]|nr:type VI secretion system protein TssA [Thermodesulfobacteriota bacterium]
MTKTIDIEAILTPIPGENPAGESLRYDPVYDEIKEARRADDVLERGDWQHEIKTSDWDKVIEISVTVLTEKTKDLQIGAWLLESLTAKEGFEGLHVGLRIMTGFLQQFWDHVYPLIEDDDLDYRVGPLEFINDKVWLAIKQIPVTDRGTTPGYSWMKWQESRQVGAEQDIRNQYGDVDDNKRKAREEAIAEGKLTIEDFDAAVVGSPKSFYEILSGHVAGCLEEFKRLDETVDEKFGRQAPRLAEFKTALEDCDRLVAGILKEKKELEPDAASSDPMAEELEEEVREEIGVQEPSEENEALPSAKLPFSTGPVAAYRVNRLLGSAGIEEAVWRDALAKLEAEGIKQALEQLLGASCSAQSIREKTNFRLLMAKLCLKGNRPDLARPIAEELNTLMEELQLLRWESPIWIAEVLDTLYQCLSIEGAPDDDIYRSREILKKICTLDVTKAMGHMS